MDGIAFLQHAARILPLTAPRQLCWLALFGILAGCETQPVASSSARMVPSDRLLTQPLLAADSMERGGKVVVTRDSGFSGSAVLLRLYVDGQEVAKLSRSERYEVILKEGEHLVGAANNLNFGGASVHEASVAVQRGQTYNFRVGFDSSGTVIIQRTAFTN